VGLFARRTPWWVLSTMPRRRCRTEPHERSSSCRGPHLRPVALDSRPLASRLEVSCEAGCLCLGSEVALASCRDLSVLSVHPQVVHSSCRRALWAQSLSRRVRTSKTSFRRATLLVHSGSGAVQEQSLPMCTGWRSPRFLPVGEGVASSGRLPSGCEDGVRSHTHVHGRDWLCSEGAIHRGLVQVWGGFFLLANAEGYLAARAALC
jgi:hypothetical protein